MYTTYDSNYPYRISFPRDTEDAASYVNGKINYSFLPFDFEGILFKTPKITTWGVTKGSNISINMPAMESPLHLESTAVHEVNHGFNNKFNRWLLSESELREAYPTLPNSINVTEGKVTSISNSTHERRATNAEILNYLDVAPEQVWNIPRDRFIRLNPDGEITTIFEDYAKR